MFGKNVTSKSSKNKIFHGFRVFKCSMAKYENPEMPEINRKLSKSKQHPVLTFYRYQKTAKEHSLCYLSTILALITKKLPSSFNGKFSLKTLSNTLRVKSLSHKMLNAQKSASNQINSLNTSKNELIEIFRGFPGFRMCSMAKKRKPGNAGNQYRAF